MRPGTVTVSGLSAAGNGQRWGANGPRGMDLTRTRGLFLWHGKCYNPLFVWLA